MTTGLARDALARIDEQDGDVRGRGARRHVAGVLFMAGRVGDDEGAPVGREKAIGDVDGNALLALAGKAIDEEGEIDAAALRPMLARVALQRCELIVEQALGLIQQAADQRRLTVVDGAAGDEPQQALALMRCEIVPSAGNSQLRDEPTSEVALLLLAFHGRRCVLVDGASMAFGRPRLECFSNDVGESVAAVLPTAPVRG